MDELKKANNRNHYLITFQEHSLKVTMMYALVRLRILKNSKKKPLMEKHSCITNVFRLNPEPSNDLLNQPKYFKKIKLCVSFDEV